IPNSKFSSRTGMIPLPIDAHIDQIVEHVRRSRAAVVTAAPGAGKTTRVPPALMADGPVILLQPRRVAARAIAARIADERGWTLGREVGWQVRFERRFSTETRLLVVTEGVLTARLQTDPLLSDFTTIVLDEFHERSVHADLAIALARQAWRARGDLRIVVMSAPRDRGDQDRGDVADRSRRDGRRRLGAAQGGEVRRRPGHRQSRDGTHHRGRRGSAGRPRRPPGAGHRAPLVGPA